MDETKATEQGEEARSLLAEMGRRVARLRRQKGWSRGELAARLGVSRQRLGNWERAGHTPPLAALVALSRELGISLTELITGEPPAAPATRRWSLEAREKAAWHLAELQRLLGAGEKPDGGAGTPEETGL